MGQLGTGTYSDLLIPTQIENLEIDNIQEVESGSFHSCALINGGRVYCWGWNAFGQLGDGSFDNSNVPVQVTIPEDLDAVKISLGDSHSCAILENDDVYCWGNNKDKQIDSSENYRINVPIKLAIEVEDIIQDIFLGSEHTCVFLLDNDYNCLGKINVGNFEKNKKITEIVAGKEYNCLIFEDGIIYCDGIMDFQTIERIPIELTSERLTKIKKPGT
mgnify:CR=1 FL=1